MWYRYWISPPKLPPLLLLPPLLTLVTPILVMLTACGQSPQLSSHRSLPSQYVAGSFVVTTQATAAKSDVVALSNDVAAKLGCRAKDPVGLKWSAANGSGAVSTALANTYNVAFEGCDFGADHTRQIVAGLAGSSAVRSASAEAVAAALPIGDGSGFSENDPGKSSQTHLAAIHRDDACKLASASGPPVIVAVVDTGIDLNHPDLKNMLLRDASGAVVGANFVGSGAEMPPDDEFDDQNGHGTHVAGLIGAQANNGQGVVGVAACANIKLMPVRVMGKDGSGSSMEIDRGIEWAVQHGAQVINLSLGFLASVDPSDQDAFSSSVIDAAAGANVMVFAASGNDGATLGSRTDDGGVAYDFPASYNHVVAVAATDDRGRLTSFSNRGDKVALAAPGLNDLSTLMGSRYGRMSGTSMASPVMAGAYALALATARLGLAASTDRIDIEIGKAMALASVVDGSSLAKSDVAAGGMIDAAKLSQAAASKYPAGTNAGSTTTLPATPPPATPTDPDTDPSPTPTPAPAAASFGFAGLSDGASPAMPLTASVQGLPQNTYAVYFFWGSSPWSFTAVHVQDGATSVSTPDQWVLYGSRTLRAVAIDQDGNPLAIASVQLKGS